MQTTTQHQQMGYDRAVAMFAPDGRLLQVEYANKTVKQGTTSIGFTSNDGVVIIADKRVNDKLMVSKSKEKIYQIDEHIICSVAGLISDGVVLIERAQVKAQQNRISYELPIDILSIVKDTCALKQITTQSGGYRPFGVALLFAGVDEDGPQVYVTDPSGVYFQYKATAIGEFENELKEMLQQKFKDNANIKENIKLGISMLKEVKKEKFDISLVDVAIVDKDKKFKKFDIKEIEAMIK